MKKLYYLLALTMLLPIKAAADELFVVDEIQYRVDNIDATTATAIFCNSEFSGNVTVPSSITVTVGWEEGKEIKRTYQVTALEGTFQGQTGITSVTIPSSVTSIMGAFINCSSLSSVNLPSTISAIGSSTFQGCTSLTSITIPNSVKTIEAWAFNGSGLKTLVLPEGVETIENNIIGDCFSLTTVTLPNSLKSIDEHAFFNAFGLTTIISNIQEPFDISEEGLVFTSNQSDNPAKDIMVYVPANTLLKYKQAKGWNRRVINGNRQIILEEANSSSYTDGNNVVYTYSPGATKAYVKDGRWNFQTNKWTLASPNAEGDVVIPASITVGGKDYTVAGIGKYAFSGTNSIIGNVMSVTLPATIEYIDESAFIGQIECFYALSENPTSVNNNADQFILDNFDRSVLYVPDGCISKYRAAAGWNQFPRIQEANGGIVSQTDPQTNMVYELAPGDNGVTITEVNTSGDVEIPEAVVIDGETYPVDAIDDHAFADRDDITSVTIPDNINCIGEEAFAGCDNLQYINLSEATGLSESDLSNGALSGLPAQTIVFLPKDISSGNVVSQNNMVHSEDGGQTWKAEEVSLYNGADFSTPHDFTAERVNNNRTIEGSDVTAYTLCMPYDYPLPQNLTAYTLNRLEGGNTLVFNEVNKIEANKPYLITASSNIENLDAQNVVMKVKKASDDITVSGFEFHGTLTQIENSEAAAMTAYILQSDRLWHPVEGGNEEARILAGRCYLTPVNAASARILNMTLDQAGDGEATCIKTVNNDGTETFYDLSGHRIQLPVRNGLYIDNGKKVIIRK